MIEGLPLVGVGAPGLLGLVFLLVITDRLVWHKRLDKLEQAMLTQQEENGELRRQVTLLLESSIPTVNAVLGALRDAAGDDRERAT